MDKKTNKIIDKIISSLDWDSIYEVNKCFKLGVGDNTTVIPGIKRKIFSDTFSKGDVKNELRTLLKFVVDNDVPEFIYGPWLIFWTNSKWTENFDLDVDEDIDPEEIEEIVSVQSSLEVMYCPQRIRVIGNIEQSQQNSDDSDTIKLDAMLKKALAEDKYEAATKIKELKELLELNFSETSEDK